MPDLFEHCCKCDGITSRAGTFEDSFYAGDYGPLCEECYEALVAAAPETARQRDMLLAALKLVAKYEPEYRAWGVAGFVQVVRDTIAATEAPSLGKLAGEEVKIWSPNEEKS